MASGRGISMLNNLVNRHDVARLGRVTRRLEADRVLAKLRVPGQARVVEHWAHVDPSSTQWWAVPAVIKGWHRLMTGDPELPFPPYVPDKHLIPLRRRRGPP